VKSDKKNQMYLETANLRVTYVPAGQRGAAKNWAGKDTIRIQAYQGPSNQRLHLGAEMPVESLQELIETLQEFQKNYRYE
jgi:phosphoserine aminotransferase